MGFASRALDALQAFRIGLGSLTCQFAGAFRKMFVSPTLTSIHCSRVAQSN